MAPIVVVCLAGACAPADRNPQIAATIQELLAEPQQASRDEQAWQETQRFYKERAYAPAWVQDGKPLKAADALRVLRAAPDHGLAESDYGVDDIAKAIASEDEWEDSIDALAQFDLRITTGLLALGRDVAVGRVNPAHLDARWKRARKPPDFAGLLASAATQDLNTWLPSVQPQHPEYAALQKSLASLRTQHVAGDDERVRLLAMNLERWRWMPDDFGSRHILVNLPAFHLAARENGRAVLDMKVVVGEAEAERRTPIFSGQMATVVFSPYWNVPDSIVEGETAPAFARDPSFLERNNIEILRHSKDGSKTIDPASVDWDDEDELKALLFRQRPGPQNALGHVKFLFPNPFHVYLHDTPADALFARSGRALSHGCVRLEQPEALARYVLRDAREWDDERIRAAMDLGIEKQVTLRDKLPVHIVYFTAWPTDNGGFDTWADVYGHDARQAAQMDAARAGHSTGD